MAPMIEPPNSVVLLVGREQFSPPATFEGQPCVATHDCIAVGVINVFDAPTLVTLDTTPATDNMIVLGEFALETDGTVSIRDVYNREISSLDVAAGSLQVIVWANDEREPCEVRFEVRP